MAKGSASSTCNRLRLACWLLLPVVCYAVPLGRITEGKHTICLFRNLFDTECWGCGMTRALFSLLHGAWTDAWDYNRMVVVVAPLLVYIYLKRVAAAGKKAFARPRPTERNL